VRDESVRQLERAAAVQPVRPAAPVSPAAPIPAAGGVVFVSSSFVLTRARSRDSMACRDSTAPAPPTSCRRCVASLVARQPRPTFLVLTCPVAQPNLAPTQAHYATAYPSMGQYPQQPMAPPPLGGKGTGFVSVCECVADSSQRRRRCRRSSSTRSTPRSPSTPTRRWASVSFSCLFRSARSSVHSLCCGFVFSSFCLFLTLPSAPPPQYAPAPVPHYMPQPNLSFPQYAQAVPMQQAPIVVAPVMRAPVLYTLQLGSALLVFLFFLSYRGARCVGLDRKDVFR
jgi:hypothetical protein